MRKQLAPLPFHSSQWVLPVGWAVASVVALGGLFLPVSPALATWLWVAFFVLAGTLCSNAYVRRCRHVHCYITGPLFLLSAFYLSTVELGLVPFIGNTWFNVVVLGTTALAFLAEMLVGKQGNRGDQCPASH
jgi:phosphatidylserine synthase